MLTESLFSFFCFKSSVEQIQQPFFFAFVGIFKESAP